jgi:hypothetical protein
VIEEATARAGGAKETGDGQGEARRANQDLWAGEGVGEKILGLGGGEDFGLVRPGGPDDVEAMSGAKRLDRQ